MGIRQRITDVLLGDEKRKINETVRLLYEAYQQGQYEVTPLELAGKLREVSPWTIDDLLLQVQYEAIGGADTVGMQLNDERKFALNESRRLWKHDPMAQWVIWLWTFFGFGEDVHAIPEDEAAVEIWDEFWNADRNLYVLSADKIHYLSHKVLVDGEFYFVYYVNKLTGETTVRVIDTDQITEVITHPDDHSVPVAYKRQWSSGTQTMELYYRDFIPVLTGGELFTGSQWGIKSAKFAEDVNPQTMVFVQHVAHNIKMGNRGWPLLSNGAAWIKAHKRFREDRAAVASSVAMFVNQIKAKGAGSRGVDAIRQTLASQLNRNQVIDGNPPPVAGSTFIGNDASELTRMPLNTGGGDAKSDGDALLLMAGIGGGVYPHWMGAGDAYRLATAQSMEQPLKRQFSMYQKFWSAQFRDMVRIVLWSSETYSGNAEMFTTYDASVSTDRLIEADLEQTSSSIAVMYRDVIMPMLTQGLIPPDVMVQINQAVLRIMLQALGVDDADGITSDEAMGIDAEESGKSVVEVMESVSSLIRSLQLTDAKIDDEGKLVVQGKPLKQFTKADRDITIEDISAAVKAWDAQMPQELFGILGAVKQE